jgi:hypothetical protein
MTPGRIVLSIWVPQSSKPSLISYAEPYLRFLLDTELVKSDTTHVLEVSALVHLAGALASPAPLPANFLYPPSPLGLLFSSPHGTSSQSELSQSSHDPFDRFSPADTRDAEALALFARAFALYEAVSRSRGNSPSPSPAPVTPPDLCQSALGLEVSGQPAPPVITPPSPTLAYTAPASPRMPFDSPRSHHRLSGLCGRRGKLPPKTELWARASYVRLLRRLTDEDDRAGYVREAERQLDAMRYVPPRDACARAQLG